ncbi:MAG: NAD(P)-dependent oxidoreductase [Dialister invisus]
MGRVGSKVAKRLQAFNMKTIGNDPYIRWNEASSWE